MKTVVQWVLVAFCLVDSRAMADAPTIPQRIEAALEEYREHARVHSEPTGRFEKGIQETLKSDTPTSPVRDTIEFIGSSIFKQWSTLVRDMAPLPVYNRAFGGSRTSDILERVDQLVIPYRPKVIVYYAGGNDINNREPPAAVFGRIFDFTNRVHDKLPDTRIIYVAIDRAPSRKDRMNDVDAANALIRDYCSITPHLAFIDLYPVTHDEKGDPRPGMYRDDKLHFKPAAYVEFTKVIKPMLEKVWTEANTPKK